jgi:O-antigen ligase
MPVTLAQWSARKRSRQNPIWPSIDVFWNDVAIFLVGCGGVFSADVVGNLPGNEIVALFLFPFLLFSHGKRAFRREYLWFYVLLGGWLFGTVFGDLYVGSSVTNQLKGIARVVFLGLDFITLAILIDKKTRGMIIFALGVAVTFAAGARGFRGDLLTVWKYGAGYASSIVVLLVSSYFYARRLYWICILQALGLAGLNLIFAYRSQIAVDLVSIVLILPIFGSARSRQKVGANRTSEILKTVVLLGLAGAAALAANQAVKFAVSRNLFDDSIEAKLQAQSSGRLGVLVGGRPETLVAIQAIRDSPIIGHGSFAEDPKYLQVMQDIQYEYDYTDSDEAAEVDTPGIPAHSHLTQAWVESGILGGIFWIYIVIIVVCGIQRLVFDHPPMAPLYCFFLISFAWDIFFSPMGSVNRMIGDFYLLISYGLVMAPSANVLPTSHRQRIDRSTQRLLSGKPRGRR